MIAMMGERSFESLHSRTVPLLGAHAWPAVVRRALLLGARAPDLSGVDHDLELMREALLHHGFADEHIGTVVPATRDLMATAIQKLIACTQPGDVVVVYYSGHGSKLDNTSVSRHMANPRAPVLGELAYYRFLVPSDIEQSTNEDFRGYTNLELSLDLAALTRKTRNVVMIMDCCHAGRLFRANPGDADERIVWQDNSLYLPARNVDLGGRWAHAAAKHFERLLATRGHELADRHAEANPWAIRLLASSSEGGAFETRCPPRQGCDHHVCGAMTLALHAALMKVDPRRTTWQDLGRLIRMTPQRGSRQRVCVEGPHRRFLFMLEEREPFGEIDLDLGHDRILLAGGRLVGLMQGDRFELRALKRGSFEAVGDAEVTRVSSSHAEVTAHVDPGQVDGLSHARPVSYGAPRATVELVGIEPDSKAYELLAARLVASGLIRVLNPDEASDNCQRLPSAGQLRLEQGKLQLSSGGIAFDVPRTFDPGRAPVHAEQLAEHMADGARRLARAACLLGLPEPSDSERLEPCWELSWTTVETGKIGRVLAAKGEHLRVGDGFTVCLTCSRPLYFSVLRVRADAGIELLTRAQGGGVEVVPGQGYLLGQRSGSTSAKLIADRPPHGIVGGSGPVWAALVLVLSDLPVDLRSWVQPGLSRFVMRDNLQPESHGRNVSPPLRGLHGARYHVETWTFDVT